MEDLSFGNGKPLKNRGISIGWKSRKTGFCDTLTYFLSHVTMGSELDRKKIFSTQLLLK